MASEQARRQTVRALLAVGASGAEAATLGAIAEAESGDSDGAHSAGHETGPGTCCHGRYQINLGPHAHPEVSHGTAHSLAGSSRAALRIARHSGYGQWTTYGGAAYAAALPAVRTIVRAELAASGRGSEGSSSTPAGTCPKANSGHADLDARLNQLGCRDRRRAARILEHDCPDTSTEDMRFLGRAIGPDLLINYCAEVVGGPIVVFPAGAPAAGVAVAAGAAVLGQAKTFKDTAEALTAFFRVLTSGKTWIRVGMFIGGGALVMVGTRGLARLESAGTAARSIGREAGAVVRASRPAPATRREERAHARGHRQGRSEGFFEGYGQADEDVTSGRRDEAERAEHRRRDRRARREDRSAERASRRGAPRLHSRERART